MTERQIKLAIVGAGIWGRNHALALTTHPRGNLAIICDRDEGRAQALADTYGCPWTTSLDELAASDVEAVTIATPGECRTSRKLRRVPNPIRPDK